MDFEMIAAHLTAGIVDSELMKAAKGKAAENVAKVYFDVLDALKAEDERRKK